MKTSGQPTTDLAIAQVPAEVLRPLLARILKSRQFATAGRKQKFLEVVCESYLNGNAGELTEVSLAFDVFGRDTSYDPSQDPSVRVCAHEVRKKLAAYFALEGAEESIILEIPAGGYRPIFLKRPSPLQKAELTPELTKAAVAEPISTQTGRKLAWVAAFLACSLVSALVGASVAGRRSVASVAADSIWQSFFADRDPSLAVVSNPPVFQFLYESDPVHQKTDAIPLTDEQISKIEESTGKDAHRLRFLVPAPDDYTGLGEALSLAQITRFFARSGKGLVAKQSRTTSTEDLKTHHVILIGGPLVNAWARESDALDFDLNGNFVLNRKPHPGEQREYRITVDQSTGEPLNDWAVVSLLPGMLPGKQMLTLMGIRGEGCQGAAEFVTDDDYLALLQQKMPRGGGASRYFQALLRVEIKNHIPTSTSLVALHPLTFNSSNGYAR